jgi:hypothetical protein
MGAFLDRYYPVEDAANTEPPADFVERITPYLGEYFAARNNYTTIEKVFSLFNPMNVSLSEEGYLVVSAMGEVKQFTEIEPGLLQQRDEPSNQFVYRTDANGYQYLLPSAPFVWIKTPWYGTMAVNGVILLLNVVLFASALIRWIIGFFKNLRKGETQPALARLAHWNAGLFGLLLLVFIIGFLAVMGDMIPVYGVPRIVFEDVPLANALSLLPWLMALTGFAMPVFMVLAWVKRYWTISGRIFYTVLTVCSLSWLWVLYYWNFWL